MIGFLIFSILTQASLPQVTQAESSPRLGVYFAKKIHPKLVSDCRMCHMRAPGFVVTESVQGTYLSLKPYVSPGQGFDSTLYKKAVGLEFHGGGTIWNAEEPQARSLVRWIDHYKHSP